MKEAIVAGRPVFLTTLASIACLVLLSTPGLGAQEQPLTIGLAGALEIAREQNALLRAAALRIDESRGDVVSAAVRLIDNPELSLETGPRSRGSGDESTDWSVGLSQRFELRGQRRSRMQQAENLLAASEHGADDARRVLDLGITLVFFDLLASGEEVSMSVEGERLAQTLLELSERRLDLGEGTPLELNTARLRFAAARAGLLEARARERTASLRLKELLGIAPSRELSVLGSFPAVALEFGEETLVEQALNSRPDLRASELVTEAARAGVELEAARSWPGIEGGFSFENEEDDEIALATISIPLPLRESQSRREAACPCHRTTPPGRVRPDRARS